MMQQPDVPHPDRPGKRRGGRKIRSPEQRIEPTHLSDRPKLIFLPVELRLIERFVRPHRGRKGGLGRSAPR